MKFIGNIHLMVVQIRVRLVKRNYFETKKFAVEEILFHFLVNMNAKANV